MSSRQFPKTAPDERHAWLFWLGLFVFVALENALTDSPSVSREYLSAALRWMLGETMYRGDGRGFLYLPHAAILHVPFALLETVPGEILWRLATIGLFALGVRALCQLSIGGQDRRLFPLATMISLPLAVSAARNGQSTLLICGLTMLAVGALVQQRYNRSALLLIAALAFKPTALPFLLMVGALQRAMLPRLLLGLAALAVAPYLFQDPGYVTSQYLAFAQSLEVTTEFAVIRPFSNVFGMLDLAGLPTSAAMQMVLRGAVAVATLLLCARIQNRLPAPRYGLYLVAVTTGYTLLFNPRTENNSYVAIAPVIGLFCGEAFFVRRDRMQGLFLLAVALLLLSSYEVSVQILPEVPAVWMPPLIILYWCAVTGVWLQRELTESGAGEAAFEPTVQPALRGHHFRFEPLVAVPQLHAVDDLSGSDSPKLIGRFGTPETQGAA